MKTLQRSMWVAVIGLALGALACNLGAPASPTQPPLATAAATLPPIAANATASGAPAEPSQPAAASTQAEAASPTAPAAPSGDPLDIIGQAQRAQLNAKSFRIHITGNDGDTKYEITIEYVAPDHLHTIIGGTLPSEYIYIKGVGTWKKGSDGKWAKASTDVSKQVFAAYDPAGIDAIMKNVVVDQVKFLGPELKDGRPTFVYQFVSRTKLGNGTDLLVTSKMWIGATDGLPYRLENDNDSILHAGAKAHSESVIDYDPNIKIETPIS